MSQYGSPAANPPANSSGPGFFGALFDFSFGSFITPMIVKTVYVLAVAVLALFWLVFLIAAFSQSVGAGLGVLIFGPVFVLIYLAFIRMTLEFFLALVRMS